MELYIATFRDGTQAVYRTVDGDAIEDTFEDDALVANLIRVECVDGKPNVYFLDEDGDWRLQLPMQRLF